MKKLMKSKKGMIGELLPLITGVVGLGITLVIGFLILAQVATNNTVKADGNATAAVTTVQTAMNTIPGWIPIVIVAVIGGLLLGLVSYFSRK